MAAETRAQIQGDISGAGSVGKVKRESCLTGSDESWPYLAVSVWNLSILNHETDQQSCILQSSAFSNTTNEKYDVAQPKDCKEYCTLNK